MAEHDKHDEHEGGRVYRVRCACGVTVAVLYGSDADFADQTHVMQCAAKGARTCYPDGETLRCTTCRGVIWVERRVPESDPRYEGGMKCGCGERTIELFAARESALTAVIRTLARRGEIELTYEDKWRCPRCGQQPGFWVCATLSEDAGNGA